MLGEADKATIGVTTHASGTSATCGHMKISDLEEKFWTTARTLPLDERVPYAFEKRIMTLVKSRGAVEPLAFWSRVLWRAAAPCIGVMLAVGAAAMLQNGQVLATMEDEGYADFETAMVASFDDLQHAW